MRLALFALLVGCAQEPAPQVTCDSIRVSCPNDSPATEERLRAECRARAAGKCADPQRAVITCTQASARCDGAGHYDERATSAQCEKQLAALRACSGGDAGVDAPPADAPPADAPDAAIDTMAG